MVHRIIFTILKLFVSIGAGILATVIAASPVLWYMNATANDGPIFPPPLVAFGFLALPIAVMLFPIQLAAGLFESFRRKIPGVPLMGIALIGGLLAGSLLSLLLGSSQTTVAFVQSILGVGLLQSLTVFGVHGLANKLADSVLQKPSEQL